MAPSNNGRPGWYSDPQFADMERYWNGAAWEGAPRSRSPQPKRKGRDEFVLTDSQKRRVIVGGLVFIAVCALFTMDAYDVAASGIILAIASPFILIAVVLWLLWRAGNNKVPEPQGNAQYGSSSMAPGWYPDQVDPTLNRWWDGIQWTSATLPRQ